MLPWWYASESLPSHCEIMFSAEKVVVCLVFLEEDEVEEAKRKRKASFWIHNSNRKRINFEEYHTLFPDLTEDDE